MTARDLGLTFAGGGNRAFYQMGLLEKLGERLFPRVGAVAACSAGACVVTFYLAGRRVEADKFWKDRRRGITKNFDLTQLLRGRRPTPHAPIYRDTLLHAYDHGGLEAIARQPFPILVLAAGFPRGVPAPAAVAAGLGVYSLEKAIRKQMVHPSFGKAIGFSPVVFDARACRSKEELADLILASSATPPFTPVGSFRGQRLLDGGMVDNAPAFLLDDAPGVRKNVVFLTRPYPPPVLGPKGRRLYLAPSGPVPVTRWDYTRPDLLDETIAMGEREAAAHWPVLRDFLGLTSASAGPILAPP